MKISYPKKVAVVFGGQYAEHDISIFSFKNFYRDIQSAPFCKKITLSSIYYITRLGTVLVSDADLKQNAEFYFEPGRAPDTTIQDLFLRIKRENEFVYLICDGPSGKDGRFTSIAETLGIRGTFGSPLGFALSRSKFHMNRLVSTHYSGIHIPKTRYIRTLDEVEKSCAAFGNKRVVVKSNSLGSSIHTRMFDLTDPSMKEIRSLCNKILELDRRVIIQEYIKGDELGCYCLEKNGDIDILAVKKMSSTGLILDAQEKYKVADRSHDQYVTNGIEEIKEFAMALFHDADLRNLSRMDFIQDHEKRIYFLENNANPALRGFIDAYTKNYSAFSAYDMLQTFIENEFRRHQVKTDYFFNFGTP